MQMSLHVLCLYFDLLRDNLVAFIQVYCVCFFMFLMFL